MMDNPISFPTPPLSPTIGHLAETQFGHPYRPFEHPYLEITFLKRSLYGFDTVIKCTISKAALKVEPTLNCGGFR